MERLRIALAGNANVGKSVIFNELTGLHQHIGNWPGKTVEKAEGTLHFKGRDIDVIDLPGIYSLSTYSLEEEISREYILNEKPDVVINVINASVLERNLYFTLQLLELGRPMVIALNQVDTAKKEGLEIDHRKLSKLLGVPVVPTIAVKSMGLTSLLDEAIKASSKRSPEPPRYGNEIEKAVSGIVRLLENKDMSYPKRWFAIKLLQNDRILLRMPIDKEIIAESKKASSGIERFHKHPCRTAIVSEIYGLAASIANKVQRRTSKKRMFGERLDDISTHRVWGYPIMAAVILGIFFGIFVFGNGIASMIEGSLSYINPVLEGLLPGIPGSIMLAAVEGLLSTLTVVIPYILPFYIALGILESSGYMARIAFMMDGLMHRIGLHGKAFIPLMMGFGCNVPACLGCKVMETHRERLIAIFVVTLIPCAAVTTVILGLVGRFVGIGWALLLYMIDAAIVLALGRIAFKVLPGEPTGLIMEMPSYKVPHYMTILRQTWFKISGFVKIAFPVIVASTVAIKVLEIAGALEVLTSAMSPVTVEWLGLPVITGVLLIFGILKKELTLVMLASYMGTTNFALALTPVQMLVFALVTMLYIPCAATISTLIKEIGVKKATFITVFEILFAILVGGIAFRFFVFLGI
ncbi:MAG: ferrous iron transport protein B [Candidatus Aenigmarchaeota archaeon]|nr:ferrous iron transport protein B [Candidatus Aenigmarchaeota archaeon]